MSARLPIALTITTALALPAAGLATAATTATATGRPPVHRDPVR